MNLGLRCLLSLSLLLALPAEATRRPIRIDFGGEWSSSTIGSANCPGSSSQNLLLQWRGFEFSGLSDPALLVGAYCQNSVGGQFSGLSLPSNEEPALAGLVGPNADNHVRATRYAYVDTINPFEATRGFQWAMFMFPFDFALVGLYGVAAENLTDATAIRRGSQVLWAAARDGFDGEYFCFDGSRYLGRWNGEFSGTGSACLDFIRQRPLLAQAVSRRQSGQLASGASQAPSLSGSGRFVAFTSFADNLTAGDGNNQSDVFVFDRAQSTVELISSSAIGVIGNGASSDAAIGGDGRFVAFASRASNLIASDSTNLDIFRKDRQNGAIERINTPRASENCSSVSIADSGRRFAYFCSGTGSGLGQAIYLRDLDAGTDLSIWSDSLPDSINFELLASTPQISADGRLVTFATRSQLLAGDSNALSDVYVYRVADAVYERASVAGNGTQANGDSDAPRLSSDGCLVVFHSDASNLVTGDSNARSDVFLRDRCLGGIERVSLNNAGVQTVVGGAHIRGSVSADGRFVAFQSNATEFQNAVGVSGSVTVVRQRLGTPGTRVAATPGAGGHVFDSFAIDPLLSADGLQLTAVASGSDVSDQIIALDQPFIPARPLRVFADGFD